MRLIDTNIFIDHLRGYEEAEKYLERVRDKQIIFSAVTESELISGKSCRKKENKQKILQLLHNWKKIEVNNPIAVRAGDIRRKNDILLPDAIIAATALNENAKIITRNVKDFEPIENLETEKPYP